MVLKRLLYNLMFGLIFDLSSASALNLDNAKILSFSSCKGLIQPDFHVLTVCRAGDVRGRGSNYC